MHIKTIRKTYYIISYDRGRILFGDEHTAWDISEVMKEALRLKKELTGYMTIRKCTLIQEHCIEKI